jgi:hypothetical protein
MKKKSEEAEAALIAKASKIRISTGWPKRGASCGAIGECWPTEASSDRHAELFVSPGLTDGLHIADVLAHELVHATIGAEAGHGKAFKHCALEIGLRGPMRATTAGEEFVAWAKTLFQSIGPYPAGYLTDTHGRAPACSSASAVFAAISPASRAGGSPMGARRSARPTKSR